MNEEQGSEKALFGMNNKQLGLLLGLMGVLVIALVMLNSQGESIAHETLTQGDQTSQETQKMVTINSMSEWESEIPADIRDEAGTIDFQNQTVLAAFAGQKSTGGHTVQIENIKKQSSEVVANVKMTEPGEGCSATTVITYPYHIVTAEKITSPVSFETATQTVDCQ